MSGETRVLTLPSHVREVYKIDFDPHGERLSALGGGRLLLWEGTAESGVE